MEYNIFVASSMSNLLRDEIDGKIQNVNNKFQYLDVEFKLVAYSETPISDPDDNTQLTLNGLAAASDLFILLAENNKPIGKYTMDEYGAAFNQSLQSTNGRPYIKAFATYRTKGDAIDIKYVADDGNTYDFGEKLHDDSKRYIQCLQEGEFLDFFEGWLEKTALFGLEKNLRQKELSYGDHLHKIGQGGIRQNNMKYYRREKLDGAIEEIFKHSPIAILVGNTYSGKTRAAFEYMKSCKEWEDYYFHIYDNRNSVSDLNKIRNLDYSGKSRGDILLIDDINEIFDNNDIKLDRTDQSETIWAKINGYNQLQGFKLEDLGKVRIIITVSGKLSSFQKKALYSMIFNNNSAVFHNVLEKIIVDFDIYDPASFKGMVGKMIRDGVISRNSLSPGNFTIGSLFIRRDDIREKVNELYIRDNALVLALAWHFKYAVQSRFVGLYNEIRELYDYIVTNTRTITIAREENATFEGGIERMRQEGLVVLSNGGPRKIAVDKYLLDIFNNVVCEQLAHEHVSCTTVVNSELINYAKCCQEDQPGRANDRNNYHIFSVAQMAYLLVDRNRLDDDQIIDLISIVGGVLFSGKNNKICPLSGREDNNCRKLIEVLNRIGSAAGVYHKIFVSTAIANINNFQHVAVLMNSLLKYIEYLKKNSQMAEEQNAVDIYKRIVYAMLSSGNRDLTMVEEDVVLSWIFEKDGTWKDPFEEKDLEDVFNLSRLARCRRDMTADEIIDLLPKVSLNAGKDNVDPEISDEWQEPEPQAVNDQDSLYEAVFYRQLAKAAANAFYRINSYAEFVDVVGKLRELCESAAHVRSAVERSFSYDFYNAVLSLTKKITYADRFELFKFILDIDDRNGVLGNINVDDEYANNLRFKRVLTLNSILEHLDENAALESYYLMQEKGLADQYSLSYLLKNEYLNFEQAIRLVQENPGQLSFLTQNQLMGKAETLSDADMCMRCMGVKNTDPCEITDENALVNYLKIKYLDKYRCIKVIKNTKVRLRSSSQTLSDAVINVVLKKFDIEDLKEIFLPEDQDLQPDSYFDKYGFTDAEIRSMRNNAIHMSMLFDKANGSCRKGKSCSGANEPCFIIRLYNRIKDNANLQFMISDPEFNGNNSILSAYMKNKCRCGDYVKAREFYTELPPAVKPHKITHYIYSVFMWYIVNSYERGDYSRDQAIELYNEELKSAYGEFAGHYKRDDVSRMMAELYCYRPLLTDEKSYDKPEMFFYEGVVINKSYIEYLQLLIDDKSFSVNGKFIYNALLKMQGGINEEVYDKLAQLASMNRVGVKYDMIFKKNNEVKKDNKGERYVLSEDIRDRLFHIDDGEFKIDSRLVDNISYIKVLWLLLTIGKMSYDKAEDFRKENKIPITESYLNIYVKNIEGRTLAEWRKNNKSPETAKQILEEGYNKILEYLASVITEDNKYIHKSLQVCLSLIAVAPDEVSLDSIFTQGKGFEQYEKLAPVISARMNALLRMRYKKHSALCTLQQFKKMIVDNCENVNIWVINSFLSTYVKIVKNELKTEDRKRVATPFLKCWESLKESCKLDVFKLLDLDDTQKNIVKNKLNLEADENGFKWEVEANVQTFSYFAVEPKICCVVSTMDEMFNQNFTYDDSGKKNCLKDTLKNYSYSYSKLDDSGKNDASNELDAICDILMRPGNKWTCNEIFLEYVTTSSYSKNKSGKTELWNEINSLWKNMLSIDGFRNAYAHYLCKNPDVLLKIDINDKDRIETLMRVMDITKFDDSISGKITKCYEEALREKRIMHA